MTEALLHINIAQSLFTALITLTKRPLNTIDKLLSGWLILVLLLFSFNLIRLQFPGHLINSWVFRVVIVMTFPSFLYLYIRYLTTGNKKFQIQDLWHFALFGTFLTTTFILAVKYPIYTDTTDFLRSLKVFPILLGSVFLITFIFYGYHTIKLIIRFIKKRDEYFSFHNSKVSIEWIKKLVYTFYVYFGVSIIVGTVNEFTPLYTDLHADLGLFFNIGCTIFLYAISFNGYKQTKLLEIPKPEKPTSNSYQKSGLKETNAQNYEKSILLLMEKEKPWLNPEISVSDISDQLMIPQHYITQVLNERLKKNFYTLINEYRTNEVIRLFGIEKYKNWSLPSIAFEAGFNSKSSFNSFFKKHTGRTPSEYRKGVISTKK